MVVAYSTCLLIGDWVIKRDIGELIISEKKERMLS